MIKALMTALAAFTLAATAAIAAPPQKFALHDSPRELPNIRFVNEEGQRMTLEDFRGKTILLNIWATWCPPCVEEMPMLDALENQLGGDDFQVVALSIDKAGIDVVRSFFDRTQVEHLEIYLDDTMLSHTAVGAFGLPATLLIDPEGRELGRLIGPADWDDPEMVEFLRSQVE